MNNSFRKLGVVFSLICGIECLLLGCDPPDETTATKDEDDETSSGGGIDVVPTGSPPSMTSNPPPPPSGSCAEGALKCDGKDTLKECQNDSWVDYSCSTLCAEVLGFTSDGCSSNQCQCGKPIDQDCAMGTGAFCTCVEASGGQACTGEQMQSMYFACYEGDSDWWYTLWCYASFVEGNQVDCDSAASICL